MTKDSLNINKKTDPVYCLQGIVQEKDLSQHGAGGRQLLLEQDGNWCSVMP